VGTQQPEHLRPQLAITRRRPLDERDPIVDRQIEGCVEERVGAAEAVGRCGQEASG
jgi:hypothetical protein